jgi:hypothetical protein
MDGEQPQIQGKVYAYVHTCSSKEMEGAEVDKEVGVCIEMCAKWSLKNISIWINGPDILALPRITLH